MGTSATPCLKHGLAGFEMTLQSDKEILSTSPRLRLEDDQWVLKDRIPIECTETVGSTFSLKSKYSEEQW